MTPERLAEWEREMHAPLQEHPRLTGWRVGEMVSVPTLAERWGVTPQGAWSVVEYLVRGGYLAKHPTGARPGTDRPVYVIERIR